MATVAVLGVPIIVQKSENDMAYYRGATAKPRKDLEALLRNARPEVEVRDLGELGTACTPDGKINYGKLGLAVKQLIAASEANTVLVIGGDHVSAFPFYFLPGQVVRADAHGDAYVVQGMQLSQWQVSGATYMAFVIGLGIKKPGEVSNVGVNLLNLQNKYVLKDGIFGVQTGVDEMLQKPVPSTVFLDIDMDVLSKVYRLPHGHTTSDLRAEDLAALTAKLKPKVVGLFECVDHYGTIPQDIVSAYPEVFEPICKAVAEAAVRQSSCCRKTR